MSIRSTAIYRRTLIAAVAIIAIIFAVACNRRSVWDTKRITPLQQQLQQARGHYGLEAGEYLIPETIAIPAGQFSMGSDPDKEIDTNEQPRHRVSLDGFEIGRLEVTNAQFADFVKATGYDNAQWEKSNLPGHEDEPAGSISWLDAAAYCEWLSQVTSKNYRLPTEAEWEYAAGGVQNVRYSWGNQWETGADNVGKVQQTVTPAAKFPANTFGLYDVNGNVWEWCADWFGDDYYKKSVIDNPPGPEEGRLRVQRGCSFDSLDKECRLAFRNRNQPDIRVANTGFRVVLAKKPLTRS